MLATGVFLIEEIIDNIRYYIAQFSGWFIYYVAFVSIHPNTSQVLCITPAIMNFLQLKKSLISLASSSLPGGIPITQSEQEELPNNLTVCTMNSMDLITF